MEPQKEQEALLLKTESLTIDAVYDKESPTPPSLDEVEVILGYKFKNTSLLEEAFTHCSYHINKCCSPSYERLEYVGDAVLNRLITKEQFFGYPNLTPGQLTRLRAANVDTEKLARAAIKNGFHPYLRPRKPYLEQQILKSLLEPIIDPETVQKHLVTELNEICQKKNLKIQFVDLWKDSTAFDVLINEKLIGRGIYGTKKEIAQNKAAKNALDNF